MITRRQMLLSTGAALASLQRASEMFASTGLTTERQRGDPDGPSESITVDQNKLDQLINSSERAELEVWKKEFPSELVNTARRFVGCSRESTPAQVSDFLRLFGLPFKTSDGFVPFCASGIAYSAAQAYAGLLRKSIDDADRMEQLRMLLPDIDYWYYYPTVSCLSMYYVALGKRRWKEPGKDKVAPKSGWIVIYDWSQRGGADHCGIVTKATRNSISTIEFNTSGIVHGNQVNGGAVEEKERAYNGQVKGFIATDSGRHDG